MNDYEKLKNTFDGIGVEYSTKKAKEDGLKTIHALGAQGSVKYDEMLYLKNGIGYASFVCEFYFLKKKYEGHGVWE